MYYSDLSQSDKDKLHELSGTIQTARDTFLGYPCNLSFDYSELFPFLNYSLNNIGDPFGSSNYRMNTRELEQEVLDFFADLTEIPTDQYWGYVTSGGSEGTLYGVYLGREKLKNPIFYYSEHAHYCAPKSAKVLQVESRIIPCQDNGEFDYTELNQAIANNSDRPAIVMATIGTTVTGATDSLETIHSILKNNHISNYYIHADAAFQGMTEAFAEDPHPWNFQANIDSISISGHKFIGMPFPCGIFLSKKQYAELVSREISYVNIIDSTLLGSRNALAPLFLWYAIKRYGKAGFKQITQSSTDFADRVLQTMKEHNILAWKNKNSPIIVLPRLAGWIADKWQILSHNDMSHIIILPHVQWHHILELINDINLEKSN